MGSLQRISRSPLKPINQLDKSTLTLPLVGAWKSTALDWRNRADVAIIIATAAIATVVSGTVITSGAIVAVGSVVFVKRPGTQETPYHRVLLGRLVIILLFRGRVMPLPGHIIVIIFIFQFPVKEELEVLAVG
jgi:hypothetical protein